MMTSEELWRLDELLGIYRSKINQLNHARENLPAIQEQEALEDMRQVHQFILDFCGDLKRGVPYISPTKMETKMTIDETGCHCAGVLACEGLEILEPV